MQVHTNAYTSVIWYMCYKYFCIVWNNTVPQQKQRREKTKHEQFYLKVSDNNRCYNCITNRNNMSYKNVIYILYNFGNSDININRVPSHPAQNSF